MGSELKRTEMVDVQAAMAGHSPQQATEVLRPKGPRIFAMFVGVEGAPGVVGQVFRLDPKSATTIGRDYSCDIILDEPAVSRTHAKVRLETNEATGKDQFFIQDLATENGTEVNGQLVVKHYLEENDRVRLGRAVLVFKVIENTTSA